MSIPDNLKYTQDHEWVNLVGDTLTAGITDFAQSELGDIIFIEFPREGESFEQGEAFGTIEAVKTVADLFMPVTGEIVALNSSLEDAPESVNQDAYGTGWLVKIKPSDTGQVDALMDAKAYGELIS